MPITDVFDLTTGWARFSVGVFDVDAEALAGDFEDEGAGGEGDAIGVFGDLEGHAVGVEIGRDSGVGEAVGEAEGIVEEEAAGAAVVVADEERDVLVERVGVLAVGVGVGAPELEAMLA